jgi:uncharacterized coiled-coil DUF342 family protein
MDNDRDIATVRSELNSLDKIKEDFFSQSKANRQKLQELRNSIQQFKNERNQLTDAVKKLKIERDELNKQLKEKIAAFKKVVPVQKVEKPKEYVNQQFLRKEIKDLEYKIETEALTFDKEQKLMKIIKDKKKLLVASQPAHLSDEAKKLSLEIDELRAKADTAHKATKAKADESQKKHEVMIAASNQLKELEAKQKELDTQCTEYKNKIRDVNEQLHGKLDEVVAQSAERRERPKKERREPTVNIAELQHQAEEKLKKGKKLTTQDLLAFQNKK